jgi:hypothetical protein
VADDAEDGEEEEDAHDGSDHHAEDGARGDPGDRRRAADARVEQAVGAREGDVAADRRADR